MRAPHATFPINARSRDSRDSRGRLRRLRIAWHWHQGCKVLCRTTPCETRAAMRVFFHLKCTVLHKAIKTTAITGLQDSGKS
ncbi:unnamed protein product [Knipowitschia caucasica]|uniref:Uncharacterized protein n=1 Tax=Knipowitschia caucasica TaxID=637954 RepID=A0AAV2J174_KNICA